MKGKLYTPGLGEYIMGRKLTYGGKNRYDTNARAEIVFQMLLTDLSSPYHYHSVNVLVAKTKDEQLSRAV
ncbi:hypothetical protein PILCRDRAFT_828269 [Piloderma croceum F 1598]|uniref:Uncharacterized protein n=1 Tax=Piloderma croceum (strain F 1598) TaxID=765440 RepID=A0A0C3EPB3_PILCF|nr:hypothetical protein PILCRDRAFT_828269 [Piloderma croceum F 1598]